MATLGGRIKQLRAEKGITQTDLATAIHSSRDCVANWETDRTKPNATDLEFMADYFNVSVDFLLGRIPKTVPANETISKDLAHAIHASMYLEGVPLRKKEKQRLIENASTLIKMIKGLMKG